MNLYRLDFVAPNGSVRTPVTTLGGCFDFLTTSAQAARERGLEEANETGSVVRCTRITGGGTMKVMWHASGETHRIHRVKH